MIHNVKCFLGAMVMLTATAGVSGAAPKAAPNCKTAVMDWNVSTEEFLEACMPDPRRDLTAPKASVSGVLPGASVSGTSVLKGDLDFTGVPVWTDAEIWAVFEATRDARELDDNYSPAPAPTYNPRRISWLYPNDGCFARAQQVIGLADDDGFTGARAPYKLWAFDKLGALRLQVDTDNSATGVGGHVNWNWHVVPLVQNTAGDYIVMDAALNPCGPLDWEDWLGLMVLDAEMFDDPTTDFEVSISDGYAYLPGYEPFGDPSSPDVRGYSEADEEGTTTSWGYLNLEWERQIDELTRNADDRFGDNPDWLAACVSPICTDDSMCDDGSPCTIDTCDALAGTCDNIPMDTVYEAEAMYHSTGNLYSPDGWNIYSNGYIAFDHFFTGGTQQMTVTASGQGAAGWPNMTVTVDNVQVYSTYVNPAGWNDYTFSFAAPVGSRQVRINFTNDYYQPPLDRNLYVDKATMYCNGEPGPEPGSLDTVLIVHDDWGAGYCAHLEITNNNTLPTSDWSVVVDSFDSNVNQYWNTPAISGTGTHNVTWTDPNWNRIIAPQTTYSQTGFCALRAAGTSTMPAVVSTTAAF